MKKNLFIVAIFLSTQFLFSQSNPLTSSSATSTMSGNSDEGFNNGDWFISGSFEFESKDSGAGKSNSTFTFLPSVGYFIKENLALIGTIGIENESSENTSTNAFVIGAAVRYYMTPASKFSLFGEGGLAFKSKDDGTNIILGVRPGLNYFVAKNFSIEANFGGIEINNSSPKSGDGKTDFKLGINMNSLGFGLNYRF